MQINQASRLLYVPCQQNVESFRECGVRIPIKVLHHGVAANLFPFVERPHRDLFTFGNFGHFTPRKGIDVLSRAFRDEFSPAEPVRLLLKCGYDHRYRTMVVVIALAGRRRKCS